MNQTKNVFISLILICLVGCSTSYQEMGFTGGYEDKQVEGDVYRVIFAGNGHTTYETVQTYWLYRAASLTLEKGYTGFEIQSDIRFAAKSDHEYEIASTVYTPIFIPDSGGSTHPSITGDIKLLKGNVVSAPPKVFNAAKLKSELEQYVNGKKCSMDNVCAHVKHYLGR